MTHRTGVLDLGDGEVYFEEAGDGPPVVLTHGGLVDHHLWDPQFEALARDFHVVRYDVRGHGVSRTRPGIYSLHEDLRRLLDHLSVRRAHLVGLSMGGEISLDFALAYPERTAGLVLVGSSLSGYATTDPEELRRIAQLDAEVQRAYEQGEAGAAADALHHVWTIGRGRRADDLPPGVLAAVREMTLRNFERPLTETEFQPRPLDPPAVGRLPRLTAPTLVVVGDRDVGWIREIADRISAEVPGARKVVLLGTAHHLNLERPDEFLALVRGFLTSLPADLAG
jgi:pimeloyl-ACP methyl ester carboxylesterase